MNISVDLLLRLLDKHFADGTGPMSKVDFKKMLVSSWEEDGAIARAPTHAVTAFADELMSCASEEVARIKKQNEELEGFARVFAVELTPQIDPRFNKCLLCRNIWHPANPEKHNDSCEVGRFHKWSNDRYK